MIKAKSAKFRPTKSIFVLLTCALVLVVSLIVANQRNQLASALSKATSHQPELYSELYFTNYRALPKSIQAGETNAVPFTVTNHEARTTTYSYQAEVLENGNGKYLPPVSFSLGSGMKTNRIVYFTANQSGDQVEIIIRLLHQNLTIHYKAQA
jgi:Protein of unknown function (DUF1616)